MAETYTGLSEKTEIKRQEAALEQKNKWIYPTVIALLIVIFIVGFIYGLGAVLRMEGAFPPVELTESKTPVPQSEAEALSYLQSAFAAANEKKPAFSSNWRIRFDEDSIQTDGSPILKQSLLFLSEPIRDYLESKTVKTKTDFGENFSEHIVSPAFDSKDILSFSCDYIYYECLSCENQSDVPLDHCEACGSVYPYQMHYRDTYTIILELRTDGNYPEQMFAPSASALAGFLSDESAEKFSLTAFQETADRLFVRFETDRATDRLINLCYGKEGTIQTSVMFEGDYSSLDKADLSIACSAETNYRFTWPALVLDRHALVLEPKGTGNLNAERICSDPTLYDAVWSSSDESVVYVDDEGYLKAGKNPGSAVITASYEFQGETYSDTCDVTVRISVKSLKLNKHRVRLGVKESFSLDATVSPKDATVKTVTWYTTEPSVVSVDQNGKILALSPGSAVVYALSDDGYYKSSCEVTVK